MSKSGPEKLKMKSPDMALENVETIARIFPNVVTEIRDENGGVRKGIDFDLLKQELSGNVCEGREERYEFTWVGKKQSIVEGNLPIQKTLRPCMDESKDWERTKNIYIEGDNLEALKLLQESYLNKVKIIYIDPLYNTGNDYIYKDKSVMDIDEYYEETGAVDENGYRMIKNTKDRGRYHSDWCSMIYPRLKLAHNLLKEDGIIFVSIDDNESHNLRKIMDEVFGEENFLTAFYVKVRYEGKTLVEDMDFQKLVEQVLIYGKSSEYALQKKTEEYSIDKFIWKVVETGKPNKIETLGGKKVEIFNADRYKIIETAPSYNNLKEIWATGKILDGNSSGRFFRDFLSNRKELDGLGVIYKVDGIGDDNYDFRYFTGPKKATATKGKYYQGVPKDIANGEVTIKEQPIVNFGDFADNFGNCRHEGNVEFRDGKKPINFLKTLFKIVKCEKDDIVLDFFAGSSSTAHAVFSSNLETDLHLKFLMIQFPEKLDPSIKEQKNAYDFCIENNIPPNISEIGKERIRRAGEQIIRDSKENSKQSTLDNTINTNPDIGFRVFKIDDTNMKDVYYSAAEYSQETIEGLVDNVRPDRTDLDLLYQIVIDWGLPLDLPHEIAEIDGFHIHIVDGNALIACFDANIPESVMRKIAEKKPLRAVFRDGSFRSSPGKLNIEGIFKMIAPDTTLRVI